MSRLRLADGTSSPAPDVSESGVAWKLRYAPDALTRQEAMRAAEIIAAYNYLFEPSMTAEGMGRKVAMLRRAHREQEPQGQ